MLASFAGLPDVYDAVDDTWVAYRDPGRPAQDALYRDQVQAAIFPEAETPAVAMPASGGRRHGDRAYPRETFPARYRAAYRACLADPRKRGDPDGRPTVLDVASEMLISVGQFRRYRREYAQDFPPVD